MTPRAYFTLRLAALIVLALAALTLTVLIVNFISFGIRFTGQDALLGFGPRGLGAFLRHFPWHLLLIDIGLILLLQWLLRHFKLGYKTPVLYLAGILVITATVIGMTLDLTRFNERIVGRANLPPPLHGLYRRMGEGPGRGSGICRCEILEIHGNTLLTEDTRDSTSTLTVILPTDDPRATTTSLQVGDVVFIAGEEDNGIIRAFGVSKTPPRGGMGPGMMQR